MVQTRSIIDIALINPKHQKNLADSYWPYSLNNLDRKPFANGLEIIDFVLICSIIIYPSLIISLTTRYFITVCFEPLDLSLILEKSTTEALSKIN